MKAEKRILDFDEGSYLSTDFGFENRNNDNNNFVMGYLKSASVKNVLRNEILFLVLLYQNLNSH